MLNVVGDRQTNLIRFPLNPRRLMASWNKMLRLRIYGAYIDETLDWMDENPEAEKEDYDGKQKEVENIANPIMRSFYAGGDGGGDDDMGDFGDEEL